MNTKKGKHAPCSIRLCMAAGDRVIVGEIYEALSTAVASAVSIAVASVESALPYMSSSPGVVASMNSSRGSGGAVAFGPTPRAVHNIIVGKWPAVFPRKGYARISTQNVEPSPCLERTPSRPPLSFTMERTSAKPSPVPLPPAHMMSPSTSLGTISTYLAVDPVPSG